MEGDAPRLTLTACARSNDEIMCFGANGCYQTCDEFWIICAVPIHEDDNVGVIGPRRPQRPGAANAPPSRNDGCAGPAGAPCRLAPAAAAGHNDPVTDIAGKRTTNRANRHFFVQRWDDD